MKLSAMLFLLLLTLTQAYLPIFCLHGLYSNAGACRDLKNLLNNKHRGQYILALDVFEEAASLTGLNIQVQAILKKLKVIVKTDSRWWRGFHMVCHSQGALLCRCITQAWDDHKIHSLVSLAGPQMGVYSTAYLDQYVQVFANYPALTNITINNAYQIFDGVPWQKTFSIANLWHDAYHEQNFLDNYLFLPYYNNLVAHENMDQYKRNLAAVKQAVFLIGDFGDYDYDGGVGPWQSGVWGYYGTNGDDGRTMKNYTQHRIWQEDLIGLRALDDAGRLYMEAVRNVEHGEWIHNWNIMTKYYLDYLV